MLASEIVMSAIKPILFVAALTYLIISGLDPKDRFTWLLESLPALLALPALSYFDRKYGVTLVLYLLICVHCVVLCVGGQYTYAEVPAGFWFRDWLGLDRNHYDRFAHVIQGLQPAILAREVLLRKRVLPRGFWLSLFCISLCLAFSAFYEIVEWWTAAITGEAADSFLGTQGDPWDTQWDMFLAFLGSVAAILTLSRVHDRQLAQLEFD